MQDHGSISHGKAGDVAVGEVPLVVVPSQRRESVERRDRKREDQLADDGRHEPKPRGCFQHGVGHGTQLQPVSHYGGAHIVSPYQIWFQCADSESSGTTTGSLFLFLYAFTKRTR